MTSCHGVTSGSPVDFANARTDQYNRDSASSGTMPTNHSTANAATAQVAPPTTPNRILVPFEAMPAR